MHNVVKIVCLMVVLSLVVYTGCSGNDSQVMAPDNQIGERVLTADGAVTCLWGMWEVTIEKSTGEVNITRLREADLALNVLGFLEPPALVNMTIDFDTLVLKPGKSYIGVDVILTHPIPVPFFKGFDVRGIVFGPDVTNADGYTRWFNPDEFTGTPFGYIDGLLGVPDSAGNFNSSFNPYKYFADDIGLTESVADFYSNPDNVTNRGVFSEGETNTRHYDLQFGGDFTDFMVFNYAIAASYNQPTGVPPFDLDDFDINTCNQAEPVFIDITETGNTFYYDAGIGEGNLDLEITVFDWVKPVTPETVMVDGGTAFAETAATFDSEIDDNTRLYTFSVAGEPVTTADLELVISVTTPKTYDENYFKELMPPSHPLYGEDIETIFKHAVAVSDQPFGNLCTDISGVPEFDLDVDLITYSGYEDMCTTSDDKILIHDGGALGSGDMYAVQYYPFINWDYGVALTGDLNTSDIIIQIECDSNDNVITAYEGDDSFDVWEYDGSSLTYLQTVFLVVDDIAALCLDADDNLWVLGLNYEMHKFEAGTYTHDTTATFDVSDYVYGWIWDFVIDEFDGKFYILHEDDGTSTVDHGVVTKFSAAGIYEMQLAGVFPQPIIDWQLDYEDDPGEADIIIDNSDPSQSSCRIICVADGYDSVMDWEMTQVVRLRAYDLTDLGTPLIADGYGASCAVMSRHTDTAAELFFCGESNYWDYIDSFIMPIGGVW